MKSKLGEARIYSVETADREKIDEAFNELHRHGKLTWTKS